MIVIRILVFLLGFALVIYTMISAVRTFVLARAARDRITATVFHAVRLTINAGIRFTDTYEQRDRLMAFYAPIGSLSLLPVWLFLVSLGYSAMFWASGVESWLDSYTISGSSLLTLGFERGETLFHTILAFTEATIGLILVALLIAFLPTMYSAFSRRELAVTLLEVRAGSPPSPVEILNRQHRIGAHEQLNEVWSAWSIWFAEIEESHTTLATLVFFRSPDPMHSWITASGAVLDAAALTLAVVETPLRS